MLISITIIAALLLNFILPFGYVLKTRQKKQNNAKAVLGFQIFVFFSIVITATIFIFGTTPSTTALAEGTVEAAATVASNNGWKYLAAALSTGIGSIGAGLAVASAASAALGALSEDSTIMGKALIFVALAEGVAIYGLLISLLILFA